MTHYDVFNGDADGICSLQQLRLSHPHTSVLVTGVKRDIELLAPLKVLPGDKLTVLDISLEKNRVPLLQHLEAGASINYFDHHYADDIPTHPRLRTYIDTSADTCTSLIVNSFLRDKHLAWAVVGAFGDSLDDHARRSASTLSYSSDQLKDLRQLGISINYNAYGEAVKDLFFAPADLFRALHPYANPLDFLRDSPIPKTLQEGYESDLAEANKLKPRHAEQAYAIYELPNAPWARRVSGVFGNELSQKHPERAHALLTHQPRGGFLVSVRAPANLRQGADTVCRQFSSGGGRKGAAGINFLPEAEVDRFIEIFRTVYGNTPP